MKPGPIFFTTTSNAARRASRILNIFRHLLGVTAFAIDPYQIGYENEEGIESGAFWFYRKLGFRPTKPDIQKLVAREEEKLASRPTYRTSAGTLRKLAAGPMIFELDRTLAERQPGNWDQFQVRNIGLAVQRRMATRYGGESQRLRAAAVAQLAHALGLNIKPWSEVKMVVFSDFAVTLSLVENLREWSAAEKQALIKIIRAKAASDESNYLKLLQKHQSLRSEIIRLGS